MSEKKKDLNLNAVSKYSKVSPKFILEEHSHCEVPAGCGGVVIRWINPHKAVPVEWWIYANVDLTVFLDGARLSNTLPLMDVGEHVFSLYLHGEKPADIILKIAGIHDYEKQIAIESSNQDTSKTSILTLPDGSWKYSLKKPVDDAWLESDFDDSAWPALTGRPARKIAMDHVDRYRLLKLDELGAKELSIGNRKICEELWVRKNFNILR